MSEPNVTQVASTLRLEIGDNLRDVLLRLIDQHFQTKGSECGEKKA